MGQTGNQLIPANVAGFAVSNLHNIPDESLTVKEIEMWRQWRGAKARAEAEAMPRGPEVDSSRLTVKIVSARNLVAGNALTLSIDPYVKVKVGGVVKETKVQYGTKNPTWNQ